MYPKSASSILGIILITAAVCIPAWFLGGNMPGIRTTILALLSLTSAILLLRGPISAADRNSLPATILQGLLLLSVIYVGIQAIDLPGNPLRSQYPAATRLALGKLILGVVAFSVFSRILIRTTVINSLFIAATSMGVAVTIFGLVQRATWNGKLFWTYDLIYGGQPFGPFVNGNNASGFLLMCFAAANYFLATRLFRDASGIGVAPRHKENMGVRLKNALIGGLVRLDTKILYTYTAIVVIAAGIVASLSRGALIALAVSTLVGWLVMANRKWTSIIPAVCLLAAGLGVALYAENQNILRPNSSIADGLQSLANFEEAAAPRLEHWKVGFEAAKDHLATGSGLGTYPYVYPAYQEAYPRKLFVHAENQYLETLVELGLPGAVLLASVIALCMYLCIRLLLTTNTTSRATGVAGLMCLGGQMVAGAIDFGLYQPANSLLLAAMMGAVVARGTWETISRGQARISPIVKTNRLDSAIIALLLISACWATYEYSAVDAGEATSRYLVRFKPSEDAERLSRMQAFSTYAVSVRPDDAENHLNLAKLEILRYRMKTSDELLSENESDQSFIVQDATDQTAGSLSLADDQLTQPLIDERASVAGDASSTQPLTDEAPESTDLTAEDAWNSTELTSLHRLVMFFRQTNPELAKGTLRAPAVKNHLGKAWAHLKQAESAHSGIPEQQLLQAQLSFLFESPTQEQERASRLVTAHPFNVPILFVIGLLDQQSGRIDSGSRHWRQCMEQSRVYDKPIIDYCRAELTVNQVLNQVLPQSPHRLLQISQTHFRDPGDLVLKNIILAHTNRIVAQSSLEEREKIAILIQIARQRRQFEEAIPLMRRLLETDPDNVKVRLDLVHALISTKQHDHAQLELKRCQLHENAPEAKIRRLQKLIQKNEKNKLKKTLEKVFRRQN